VAELDKNELAGRVKDEGLMKWCLGMEVIQDPTAGTITLSQRRYLKDCLAALGLTDAKPARTPAAHGQKLTMETSPTEPAVIAQMAKVPYRMGVGKALYATLGTRGDCSFQVQQLTRVVNNPSPAAWSALKRLFLYLKHTIELSLVYRRSVQTPMYAYVDSDWASCLRTRRSVTGFVIMYAGAAIAWASKQQPVVALSTYEAEYIAGCLCAQEVVWIRGLLKDIGDKQEAPTKIYCDNQAAIAATKNPGNKRAKHIDIRYHWVRMQVLEHKTVEFIYCSTNDNVADMLTKSLSEAKVFQFRTGMMGSSKTVVCNAVIVAYQEAWLR
jgi:hypothetical protein